MEAKENYMKILFNSDDINFEAEFNDTQTAKEVIQSLPITSTVSTWGDEIYFDIGVKCSPQNATMDVGVGDIAYWTQGHCLCVFFGPTPSSDNEKPVPASPVVIVGKTNADSNSLRKIKGGATITVSIKE
jgi:hypothetical protein